MLNSKIERMSSGGFLTETIRTGAVIRRDRYHGRLRDTDHGQEFDLAIPESGPRPSWGAWGAVRSVPGQPGSLDQGKAS
jgi:hypothetical protein